MRITSLGTRRISLLRKCSASQRVRVTRIDVSRCSHAGQTTGWMFPPTSEDIPTQLWEDELNWKRVFTGSRSWCNVTLSCRSFYERTSEPKSKVTATLRITQMAFCVGAPWASERLPPDVNGSQ
ncbi:uncharacterized protein LOC143268882 [Peromyscus maniculatus bairdii]|uniref:uncharacterized protein LOC143268882 n=1 Tax=Peromyscus maniculatus bairdii TaxID=230844 RepID=UPI003FD0C16F